MFYVLEIGFLFGWECLIVFWLCVKGFPVSSVVGGLPVCKGLGRICHVEVVNGGVMVCCIVAGFWSRNICCLV